MKRLKKLNFKVLCQFISNDLQAGFESDRIYPPKMGQIFVPNEGGNIVINCRKRLNNKGPDRHKFYIHFTRLKS